MSKVPELVLIRGLPGSGKSTMAKAMPTHKHFEADQFFVNEDGLYVFDASKLKEAHEQCLQRTITALTYGNDVVVSNTFTMQWEMVKYFCIPLGYDLRILVATGNYTNEHGVPEEAIQRMRDRWED